MGGVPIEYGGNGSPGWVVVTRIGTCMCKSRKMLIKLMKNCGSHLKIDGWVMVPRPGDKESSRETIVGGKMGGPALQGLAHAQ